MGKQAIDGDNNATGRMLATLLDWPQATRLALEVSGKTAKVTREVDGGLQTGSRPAGGGDRDLRSTSRATQAFPTS